MTYTVTYSDGSTLQLVTGHPAKFEKALARAIKAGLVLTWSVN